jgi:hypothetical protein
MTEDGFEIEYLKVSAVLLDYGCMVGPYILGGEWQALRDYCAALRAVPPASDAERKAAERQLDELLTSCAYNPNYRAFYVHRALTMPHLRDFSHLIERGVLHYFKQDYLSCMLCLIPAVEGVLRSYAASLGSTETSFASLASMLRKGKPETRPGVHKAYGEALSSFLERWLYKPTKHADFGLSHLNRHYALHALGGESFYRATDCNRLLLFFDVFADLLTLEGHGEKHTWIPDGIPEMDRRYEQYKALIIEAETNLDARLKEEGILREHSRFVPEAHPLRFGEIMARWEKTMGIDEAARRVRSSPTPTHGSRRSRSTVLRSLAGRVLLAAARRVSKE